MLDDVIKIQKAHLPRETTQYPFHKPLECSTFIAEPERHHRELIKATRYCEYCLWSILLFTFNLPVTTCKMERAKPTCPGQGVNGIIYGREWVRVLHCGRIEPAIIHPETDGPILFMDQANWGCPWAG